MHYLSTIAVFFSFGIPVLGQQPPSFIVQTLGGPQSPAPLEKLTEDWSIQLGGKKSRVFSGQEWIALRREGASLPPFPTKNCALLTSGDRLLLDPAAPLRVEQEQLFLRLDKGSEIGIPRAFLSYLCFQIPESVEDPTRFLSRLDKSKRPGDVLILKNGDRLQGTLSASKRNAVYTMNLGERSVDAPHEHIAMLATNTELQAHPGTKKSFVHVVTTAGARLQFSALLLGPRRDMLMGKTLFGTTMEVPLEQVAALSIRQGQAFYLSDLVPQKYEFTPFLGVRWPLAVDANLIGGQLSLGNDYFDKGLGMHARSKVTYALNGKYRWFESLVGLDAESGQPGHALVSVLLDGQALISRQELSGRNSILPVKLDVHKARALTLLVEFGNLGDVQGRVNWADARLIGKLD